jgi:hypothetical protein
MRARRRLVVMARSCAVAACVVVLSCGPGAPTEFESSLPGSSSFPDSVRASDGLPPLAGSATTRMLAPDTVVQSELSLAPAYERRPMQLSLQVIVRNTSTSGLGLRTLPLASCPFVLRLFGTQSVSTTPVWQSDRANAALRCPAFQSFRTEGTTGTATWNVASILGDSLPAGRYSFSYAVRTADGRTLEFTRGPAYLSADLTPPSADLSAIEWTAESRVDGIGPRMLNTVVTLRNTGARTVVMNYGACNVAVRLYRTPDQISSLVWRSEFRQPPEIEPPTTYACPAILMRSQLAPGDTLRFPQSFPMYEVMGDSLRPGRYHVNAVVFVDGGSEPGGREVGRTLAAGAVDLTRDSDRLPSSRIVDSISITATTRVIRGADEADTLRTLVLVTNTSATRREADVARDCPVTVYAYRSAALRDSLPIQKPSAYPGADCDFNPHHFALEPRQSWVFGRDVPMAAARAAVPAGRYWFTAWLLGRPNAMVAAGDAEIR